MSDFKKTLLFQHLFYQISVNELVIKKNTSILKEPIFGYNNKKPVKNGMIPNDTETLIFYDDFNKDIEDGSIPESVKTIIFEGVFDTNQLYGSGFNQPIVEDTLPKKLEVLCMGARFDHILMKGVFPNTLRELELSFSFQQQLLNGVLPESLEKLCIQSNYQHSLKGVLPKNLKILIFKGNIMSRMFESREIPEGIEQLKIHLHQAYPQEIPFDLIPKSVKILDLANVNRMYWRAGFFPEGIERLRLSDRVRHGNPIFNFRMNILPSTLKDLYLKVIGTVSFEENAIPDSIEKLEIHMDENREMSDVPFYFPTSLKELSINGFHKCLGKLPNTIEKLIMSDIHEEIKKDYIPNSVKYLKMVYVPNWNIEYLPPFLEYLETEGMDYGLDRDLIPKSLNLAIKKRIDNTKIYIGKFGFERNRNEFHDANQRIIENEEESWKSKIFHDELLEKMRRPENLMKWIERGYNMEDGLAFMGYTL